MRKYSRPQFTASFCVYHDPSGGVSWTSTGTARDQSVFTPGWFKLLSVWLICSNYSTRFEISFQGQLSDPRSDLGRVRESLRHLIISTANRFIQANPGVNFLFDPVEVTLNLQMLHCPPQRTSISPFSTTDLFFPGQWFSAIATKSPRVLYWLQKVQTVSK